MKKIFLERRWINSVFGWEGDRWRKWWSLAIFSLWAHQSQSPQNGEKIKNRNDEQIFGLKYWPANTHFFERFLLCFFFFGPFVSFIFNHQFWFHFLMLYSFLSFFPHQFWLFCFYRRYLFFNLFISFCVKKKKNNIGLLNFLCFNFLFINEMPILI